MFNPTAQEAAYTDEHLRHIAKAIAKIVGKHPQLCGCGENLVAVGDRECSRCWAEGIHARNHRRREREAMEAQRAIAAGWDTACPLCCERKPARCELCPDCGEYDREEALLEDESSQDEGDTK